MDGPQFDYPFPHWVNLPHYAILIHLRYIPQQWRRRKKERGNLAIGVVGGVSSGLGMVLGRWFSWFHWRRRSVFGSVAPLVLEAVGSLLVFQTFEDRVGFPGLLGN